MERKTISQEYCALAIDKNGTIAGMYQEYAQAGIVVAGLMDLLLNDAIEIEKKKITVTGELPGTLEHLSSLYEYLKEKPRSTDKMMRDYMMCVGKGFRQLMTDIGEALLAEGCAEQGKGGLFGNKTIYVPTEQYKEELVQTVKTALRAETISDHDMALVCILQESKNLNRYLSMQERADWKVRWKEMKRNPQNKQMGEMIRYVSDTVTALIAVWIVTGTI